MNISGGAAAGAAAAGIVRADWDFENMGIGGMDTFIFFFDFFLDIFGCLVVYLWDHPSHHQSFPPYYSTTNNNNQKESSVGL